MRKRARPQAGTGVQMFPFLDALICTMGALLVLLHAFARHGDIQADKLAEMQASSSESLETLDEVQWRIAQLKDAREKTEAQLSEERARLSHIEDHERRLREQFNQLKIAAEELAKAENADSKDSQQATNNLAAIGARVERARVEAAEARRASQERAGDVLGRAV